MITLLGELSASYGDLTLAQRAKLADLFTIRNEYLTHMIELNKRRVAVLTNPTEAGEKDMQEYASVTMASIRQRQSELVVELIQEGVNVDMVKGLLPMILLGLSQALNIPLLVGALGIDPDMVQIGMDKGTEFFKSGGSDD